jgi:hypothetical protein
LFELDWADTARDVFSRLKSDPSEEKHYKAVKKTIKYLANNPRHPGLQTHPFHSLEGPNGEKVFEAYAEQDTSAAYRVFWYYGPSKKMITIFAIAPHP